MNTSADTPHCHQALPHVSPGPFWIEIQGLSWEQGTVMALPAADLAPVVTESFLTLLCVRTVGGKVHPCPVTLGSPQSTFRVVMQGEN